MDQRDHTADVAAIAALGEPVRQRLYDHVAGSAEPVSRDEAAEAVGVAAHTARFHLDKLVEAGLLDVEHRRLTGRTGPGAGRPTKLYRASRREVAVSVPPRHYDLMASLLAAGVARSGEGEALADSLSKEARAAGRRDGAGLSRRGSELHRTSRALEALGYQPCACRSGADQSLLLRNCPFDRLVPDHKDLVCTLNREYVAGVMESLDCDMAEAVLDPGPERCCVRVVSRAGA